MDEGRAVKKVDRGGGRGRVSMFNCSTLWTVKLHLPFIFFISFFFSLFLRFFFLFSISISISISFSISFSFSFSFFCLCLFPLTFFPTCLFLGLSHLPLISGRIGCDGWLHSPRRHITVSLGSFAIKLLEIAIQERGSVVAAIGGYKRRRCAEI